MSITSFRFYFSLLALYGSIGLAAQSVPHPQAHAHNDYRHELPLWDALASGFGSVEADVHLKDGKLLVSHNRPGRSAKTLEQLYLSPLDSLLAVRGSVYKDFAGPFFLMIDIKTEASSTYRAIQQALIKYPRLRCVNNCPVKIFLSGNRPLDEVKEQHEGLALDGRPDDLGKGWSAEMMPVVSDHYSNWSTWDGRSRLAPGDLARVRKLADEVHAEGKRLRLWAIPDNPLAWKALLNAGVDLINTDRLEVLDKFLSGQQR